MPKYCAASKVNGSCKIRTLPRVFKYFNSDKTRVIKQRAVHHSASEKYPIKKWLIIELLFANLRVPFSIRKT